MDVLLLMVAVVPSAVLILLALTFFWNKKNESVMHISDNGTYPNRPLSRNSSAGNILNRDQNMTPHSSFCPPNMPQAGFHNDLQNKYIAAPDNEFQTPSIHGLENGSPNAFYSEPQISPNFEQQIKSTDQPQSGLMYTIEKNDRHQSSMELKGAATLNRHEKTTRKGKKQADAGAQALTRDVGKRPNDNHNDDVSSSGAEDFPNITEGKNNKKGRNGKSRRSKKSLTNNINENQDEPNSPRLLSKNLYKKSKLPQENQFLVQKSINIKIDRLIKSAYFGNFNLTEDEEVDLAKILMKNYLVTRKYLKKLGYPFETVGGVKIFKIKFPNCAPTKTWEDDDPNAEQYSGDSGVGSTDSDPNDGIELKRSTPKKMNIDEESSERKCDRCKELYYVNANGQFFNQEKCTFHWGRLSTVYAPSGGYVSQHLCCMQAENSVGCTSAAGHVWSGLKIGMNGPFQDFVKTEQRHPMGKIRAYALDCEMCFTKMGLELAKITVVALNGSVVYDKYVRPMAEIIDYNTQFSGIYDYHLQGSDVKTLSEVQQDLLNFIYADTVLIGHALENDLRALRMVHTNIVDTALLFPHHRGLPYKRKLKQVVRQILHKDIQTEIGHSSVEDSKACVELVLWKIGQDHAKIGLNI